MSMKVGVIGAGNISTAYLQQGRRFPAIEFSAIADLDVSRAAAQAERFNIRHACSVTELLEDSEVEVVLNLTIPAAHAEIDQSALSSGKHVYAEKPLALDVSEGRKVIEAGAAHGRRVGSAPDVFLGAAHQTARKLIDDGAVGTPVACVAFMMSSGVESWHPNPDFFYRKGGGPMLDMGPYYLTDLVQFLGPVAKVTGFARRSFETRTVTRDGDFGRILPVEISTHVAGTLLFESGVIGTMIMSFDVASATLPNIQIYGSEGTLEVPDPNVFEGEVFLRRRDGKREQIAHTHGYAENSRSIGLADMITALEQNRPHRCSGELALHVLEIMEAFQRSSDEGCAVDLESRVERPAPLPQGLRDGEV